VAMIPCDQLLAGHWQSTGSGITFCGGQAVTTMKKSQASTARHDCGGTSPTIVPIGRHDLGAVTACSVAPCAATRQTQLHAKLRRDALLAPGVVMSGHVRDESLHLNRNAGSPTMTRL
jgi:hypothetical protein